MLSHHQLAQTALTRFAKNETPYVSGVLPSAVMGLDARSILNALHLRLGSVLAKAHTPSLQVESPVANEKNGEWLKRSACVGINLRTTKGLFGALKYVLTLPPHINSIHLLPVFEPGVVGSLYGMASWRINQEFFDPTWARIVPTMHHVNDQLRAFVDICHGLGKTVGLDVIPHTDRFSEIALANPWLFEWFRRKDTELLSHRSNLHVEVQRAIAAYARGRMDEAVVESFFSRPEHEISTELFGNGDVLSRNARRDQLIQYLYELGYETLPATMAPPYRGLELDPSEEAVTIDEKGRSWRELRFTAPQEMSRVFGPLTRYKIWESKDDNAHWEIDHDSPRMEVFDYVANRYAAVVDQFGFDYMRGDMSHVQTRPEGVPKKVSEPYDLLRYVKRACAQKLSAISSKPRPYFAYFAESFLTADDYMTYGSEAAHLNASEAEVALGNLQNYSPDDKEFHAILAEYDELARHNAFKPSFTVFSADKDDPRFDAFFNKGSAARYFFSVFCPYFPSYSSLGFRQRDLHLSPAPNEFYTKLYVFHYEEGEKATKGSYRWGSNTALFSTISQIDAYRIALAEVNWTDFEWLAKPDKTGKRKVISWRVEKLTFEVDFVKGSASIKQIEDSTPVFKL